jgi:cholesterol transport system auxiliary component
MRLFGQSVTRLLLTATLLSLGACSILPEQAPSDVYRLPTASTASEGTSPVSWSLRVVRPKSSEALDSPHIAVIPEGNVISSYKGARWSDPAPL